MLCRFSAVEAALVRAGMPKEAGRLVTITSVGSDKARVLSKLWSSRWRGLS